jgi:hypothetical protein
MIDNDTLYEIRTLKLSKSKCITSTRKSQIEKILMQTIRLIKLTSYPTIHQIEYKAAGGKQQDFT